MKILFDADILVFRCGFAAERAKWFLKVGGGETQEYDYKRQADIALDEQLPGKMSREEGKDYALWSERFVEPVENALYNVKEVVKTTLEELDAGEYDLTMYLSEGQNYRYDIAKTRPYKGNRDKAHRPTHEEAIRDYIKRKWPTKVAQGEEADDLLGIDQTRIGPMESVIVTLDKDLDMIPGLKFDFVERMAYSITPEQAEYNFALQLLMGDATDNIPGLPGIGKAKGRKLLEGVATEDLMETVKQIYQAHVTDKDWYEYLREQGQLLWIRREPEQMWEPPAFTEEDLGEELSLY